MEFYFGDISEIDEEVIKNFKDSSIYHILAVSGTHVGFVIMGITILFDKLNVSKSKISAISTIFLVTFMALSGFTPSVVRAGIMSIVLLMSRKLSQKERYLV